MSAPEMREAGAVTPAQSPSKSNLSVVTVPQNVDDYEPEFDTALWFMAALSVSTDVQVLAISKNVKASDLGAADADIFAAILALAREGSAPTLPLIHGQLQRAGMFADDKGRARKSRMLAITTTSASPLQLKELGLNLVDASFRRAAQAMGEGLYDAAQAYTTRDLMPYTRELGTKLNLIDQRRKALGGETIE